MKTTNITSRSTPHGLIGQVSSALYVTGMTVAAKAIRYHLIAMGSGLFGEFVILSLAIHFNKIVLLYVLGPLLLFLAVLLWVYTITGIRCPHCNNLYGVTLGTRGWPSVPPKCLSCGSSGDI